MAQDPKFNLLCDLCYATYVVGWVILCFPFFFSPLRKIHQS